MGSFFFFFFFPIIRWFDSSFSIMCTVEFGEQEVGSCCFELALSLFLGLVETSRRAPKEQNLLKQIKKGDTVQNPSLDSWVATDGGYKSVAGSICVQESVFRCARSVMCTVILTFYLIIQYHP